MRLLSKNYILYSLPLLGAIIAYNTYTAFTSDDAFILFNYAKDIVEDYSYSFSGNRTNGSTAALWPVLIALLSFTGIQPDISGRILSGLFGILTVGVFLGILHKRGYSYYLIAVAALALTLNSYFLRWEFTGMEIASAMFFLLLAFYLSGNSNKNSHYVILCLSIGSLLRPEILLYLVLYSAYLLLNRFFIKSYLKIILGLSPLLCWLTFSYFYYGSIIPSTFIAKVEIRGEFFALHNLKRSLMLLASGNLPELMIMPFLLFYVYIKGKVSINKDYISNHNLLPLLFVSGFWSFYILRDTLVLSRYSLLTIPFIIIALADLIKLIQKTNGEKTGRYIITAWFIIIVLFNFIFSAAVVKPASDRFIKGFQKEYKHIANTIAEHDKENKSVILTDVGIMGYYSGATIYDFVGLVDKDRFKFDSDLEYFESKKPGFLVLRGETDEVQFLEKTSSNKILYKGNLYGLGINDQLSDKVVLYSLNWDL